MSIKTQSKIKSTLGLSKQKLLDVYRLMNMGRMLDQKMLTLLKQGKSYFHIGTSGHEAAQVALGMAMKSGYDWSYPYYRDLTYCLTLGVTARDTFLQFLSKKEDKASGGRQMPQHFSDPDFRIVSQSSPTGTQFLQAAGCALGSVKSGADEVVMVSSGEGTTSQGDFHEAMNFASKEKLPIIFFIEDNHYAISVPIEDQTAGSIAELGRYKNFEVLHFDGTDFVKSLENARKAVKHARDGNGPVLMVADVVRLLPHSSSDDQRKYKSGEILEQEKQRDPIPKFAEMLLDEEICTEKELKIIQDEVKQEIDKAADWAMDREYPDKDTATHHLFDMNYEPPALANPRSTGDKIMLVDAINHALHEEMDHNEKVLVFGQDVADGKGGVFTATKGLSTKFGEQRCFNSPLAESTIVGTAIGLAVRGYKPVTEIQFGDYVWTAMMQIKNELATMRYRSNDTWNCPVVIRTPVGGYIHGSLYHSQSIDGIFAHVPGLKIAFPSNASDAKGLLKAAIRCPDPVLFLEQKGMYRQQFSAAPEPDEGYLLPFGHARIVSEGTDITVVSWGALVQKSLEAAKDLDKQDISVEIIDIRTLNPLDMDTIFDSVKKTNKVVIAHEDHITGGFGGEIAARIADECFMWLDGPVRRVASKDCHIPFNWTLEAEILPQKDDVKNAIEELYNF